MQIQSASATILRMIPTGSRRVRRGLIRVLVETVAYSLLRAFHHDRGWPGPGDSRRPRRRVVQRSSPNRVSNGVVCCTLGIL